MALSLISTVSFITGSNNRIARSVAIGGSDLWILLEDVGRAHLYFQFRRYSLLDGSVLENILWQSDDQFPDTDGGFDGIRRGTIEITDFCKIPTGFAVSFKVIDTLTTADQVGDRMSADDDLWLFSASAEGGGGVHDATRDSRHQVATDEGADTLQTLDGVDFADGVWYFLQSYNDGVTPDVQNALDLYSHNDPLIAGVANAEYEQIATISGGSFTSGRFLTRGTDGFYVDDLDAAGIRFYDVNGAFVETQVSPSDLVGISYKAGSLVQITVDTILVYGQPPEPDAPPGAISVIDVFPGDTEITYRITPPTPGDQPITGYEISENGTSGWSDITLDSNNDYVLTGLTNGVAVTRYFRAVSDAGEGPASDAVVATPVAGEPPVEPPVVEPVDPQAPETISTAAGQIYGLHAYRKRFDIIHGTGDNFRVWHRNVEMVPYTIQSRTVSADILLLSLAYVNFIPVQVLSDFPNGADIILTTQVPRTSLLLPSEGPVWRVQGFNRVGLDQRQVFVAKRE